MQKLRQYLAWSLAFSSCLLLSNHLAGQRQSLSLQPQATRQVKQKPDFNRGFNAIWQNRYFQLGYRQLSLQAKPSDQFVAVYHPEANPKAKDPGSPEGLELLLREEVPTEKTWLSIYRFRSVDELAQLAETHAGEPHACGNLQVFSLNDSVSNQLRIIPPVYSSQADFQTELQAIFDSLSDDRIFQDIETLAGLGSRHYTSGATAPEQIKSMLEEAGAGLSNLSVEVVANSLTDQGSVVATLRGNTEAETSVIIGAHLDSIARPSSDAPGADDNATGVSILVELLRVIQSNQLSFNRTIELHAYGSEEIGLIGSRELASTYQSEQRSVSGMMQIDMTAYGPNGEDPTIFLVDHDTSYELRRQAIAWIKRYLNDQFSIGSLPVNATSDHKSWFDRGFPTLFPFENVAEYNPNIHTSKDTVSQLNNRSLTKNIANLALIFLSYQAGLTSLQASYDEQTSRLFTSEADKIFIAISELPSGAYSLSASVPAGTASVDICPIETASSAGCIEMRSQLSESLSRNQRQIFYREADQQFNAGDAWRIQAFDKQETLLSMRQIKFN